MTPPQLMPDGKVATVLAFPKSAPQDAATSDLVQRLRDETLPRWSADQGDVPGRRVDGGGG